MISGARADGHGGWQVWDEYGNELATGLKGKRMVVEDIVKHAKTKTAAKNKPVSKPPNKLPSKTANKAPGRPLKTEAGRRVAVNGRLKYRVGGRYAVLPGRGKKGVGWIVIKNMWVEKVRDYTFRKEPRIEIPGVAWGFAERFPISISDAQAEGGYSPTEYEVLWDSMHRDAVRRLVIEFKWVGEDKE